MCVCVGRTPWKRCCFSGDGEYIVAGSARQHALYIWEKSIGNLVKILHGTRGELLLDVAVRHTHTFTDTYTLSQTLACSAVMDKTVRISKKSEKSDFPSNAWSISALVCVCVWCARSGILCGRSSPPSPVVLSLFGPKTKWWVKSCVW